MRKSRIVAALLTGYLAIFSLAAEADDGATWAELMARMLRAFAAMTGQSNAPLANRPDLDRANRFGRPSSLLGTLSPEALSPWGTSWRPPLGAGRRPWANPPIDGASPTYPLDGIWETNSGAILVVRAGRARLYLSIQTFQDFDLRLDSRALVLRDRRRGSLRRYAYATQGHRLVMQDANGNLLLLRRVSAP